MPGEITLKASLHRAAYEAMPNPQQAYVMLNIEPAGLAGGQLAQPVNFSLVLDRSGSMAGEKLKQLKAAAEAIVDRLGPNDRLSVITFDETADIVVPASPVDDRDALKARIRSIHERGGTRISTGLQAGLQQLQQNLGSNLVSRMVLLTDGRTWEDQAECVSLAQQCGAAGVPISAMGMGVASSDVTTGFANDWDPQFLEMLAQTSGGEWYVVDTPDKVTPMFEAILSEMQGTAVSNANLVLRMVEGVDPKAVWRVTPMISKLGSREVGQHSIQVFLGDVQHQVGQSLLADLIIPQRQPGSYRLLQADLTYDVPGTQVVGEKVSVDVMLQYTTDKALAQQLNGAMMNIIERVVVHRLQTQALDEAAAGDVQKATRRLRAAATRLLEIGEPEMASQASDQAAQLESSGAVDLGAAQQMRNQTRKLAVLSEPATLTDPQPPADPPPTSDPPPPAPENPSVQGDSHE